MERSNPFVRYRTLLDSYDLALAAGWSDAQYVELVERLDAAVASVEGHGFVVTPLTAEPALADAVGLDGVDLWVKDDTGNVAGSHKARHLFGLALHLAVAPDAAGLDADATAPLAIASCGNAALGAAVVARALGRALRVFIPPDASPLVVERLRDLRATVEVCERRPGERGDPCYARFRAAVDAGAIAFCCQGPDAPATLDGGRTIAWELAEQLSGGRGRPARLDRVVVQVGGGALGACVGRALLDAVERGWLDRRPRLDAVQTAGAHPFERAWRLLHERTGATATPDERLAHARAHADELMWPWETTPVSVAHGILDDVTYDWLGVLEAMLGTGGRPLVVDEHDLHAAFDAVRATTGIDADHTGCAGVAGLVHLAGGPDAPRPGERVVVLATGLRRGPVDTAP